VANTRNALDNQITETCAEIQEELGTAPLAVSTLPVRMHHGALFKALKKFAILKPTKYMESAPIPVVLTKNALDNLLTETFVVTQVKFGTAQMAVNTLQEETHHTAMLREQLKPVI
jgi:hypothetical protein